MSWPENTDLKGNCNNANTFLNFLFERTFKTMYNDALLLLFHMLLTSKIPTTILTERNEMSAIFNFSRYACQYVMSLQGSSNIFIKTNTNNFALKTILCLLFEISRSLKTFKTSTSQYLVSNEHFYMINPCCDVTKTTVNEMADILLRHDVK